MARVTQTANTLTPPRFVAEWLGPGTLIPGGAKLVAAGFTTHTVKVNDAAVAEGDTAITVDALPVAIPAGTILDFGQHTTGDISMLAKVTADAAAGATTLTVEELAHEIENSSVAAFGGGSSMFAQVTAAAAAGATSLTVEALAGPIADNATATYTVAVTTVAAGTLVGRTYAERAAGTDFGPVDDSDDEVYLTAWDVTDLTINNDVELIRHETLIYEDLIPGWASLGATKQGLVRAAYQTTRSSGT